MGWNRMVERRFILVAKHNLRRCSEHRTCNLDLHCGFNTDDQCHRATHSRLKLCRDYATCEGTRLLRTVPFYSGREIASPRVYYVSGETDSVFVCVCVCVPLWHVSIATLMSATRLVRMSSVCVSYVPCSFVCFRNVMGGQLFVASPPSSPSVPSSADRYRSCMNTPSVSTFRPVTVVRYIG
jgi:hypothetical protein